jgi:hypothetical protein
MNTSSSEMNKDKFIHLLENLKSVSKPIDIPKRKKQYVKIGTNSHEMWILVNSISHDLVRGTILTSPPNNKHYIKQDMIIIHRDNILDWATNTPQ